MRGIEGALAVWKEVQGGAFASEAIRKKADLMKPEDLSLCSSLVYAASRKMTLWRDIYERFLKNKVSPEVEEALLIGTAGILELKHFEPAPLVSALVNEVRKFDPKACALVNAVLRRVEDEGRTLLNKIKSSPTLENKALFSGVPKWVLPLWTKAWGNAGTAEFMRCFLIRPYSSLRVSKPSDTETLVQKFRAKGFNAWKSPIVENGIRFSTTVFPAGLEGYSTGDFSPQSESSMLVGGLAKKFHNGGHVVDMCAGRGVKALQFLKDTDGTSVECWELSEARTRASEREARRLGVWDRVIFKTGDALSLEPAKRPSLILLDAPCSGSGTWARKPESKWKMNRKTLEGFARTQASLLRRALSMIDAGGVIIYSTCSLFREENEQVAAGALSQGCSFLPLDFRGNFFKKGAPFGGYFLPVLPWIDGFYAAAIAKN